jgi:hypothetical protein
MSYPAPAVKRKQAVFLRYYELEGGITTKKIVLYSLGVRRRKGQPRRVWKTPQMDSFRK